MGLEHNRKSRKHTSAGVREWEAVGKAVSGESTGSARKPDSLALRSTRALEEAGRANWSSRRREETSEPAVAAPRSPLLRFSSRAIICDCGLGLTQHIWIRCGVEVDYYGNSLLLDTHSSSCSSSYYADMPGSPPCDIWLLGSMNCPRVSPLSSQGSATLLRPLLPPLPLRNPGSLSI